MSLRMQRICGAMLAVLVVLLVAFCAMLPTANPAFADTVATEEPAAEAQADEENVAVVDTEATQGVAGFTKKDAALQEPAMSIDVTNNDPLSPYHETKFVDPTRRLMVKAVANCTGLEPNTDYTFYTNYEFYKNAVRIDGLSGYRGKGFKTDGNGTASVVAEVLVTGGSSRDYDTVRCICIVSYNNSAVVYDDNSPNSVLTVQGAPQPEIIDTTATNASDGSKVLPANTTASVQDVVRYSNLYVGETYKINTVVVSKATDGAEIVASDTSSFVPESSNGEVTVTTSFDTSGHAYGKEFVVYQYLLNANDTELAKHQDINDSSQTVRIEREPVSVSVKMVWQNDDGSQADAPEGASVTLQLLADGVNYGDPVVLTVDTGWDYEWTKLPKDINDVEVEYTVLGTAFDAEGFEVGKVEGDMETGFTVTNTKLLQETVEVFVEKHWVESDGTTSTKPPAGASVTLQLLADGVDYGDPVVIDGSTGWSYKWADLPKTNTETGQDIAYTVKEVAFTAEGFQAGEVTGDIADGFVITNKRTQEPPAPTVSVTVKKVWTNADGKTAVEAPAGSTVTLQLFADNIDYGTPVTISAADGWSHTWTGLPKVSAKTGKDIVYTVRETGCSSSDFEFASVSGTMGEGYVVTNKKKAVSLVNTGDDTNIRLIAGIAAAGISLVGVGAALTLRQNKCEE